MPSDIGGAIGTLLGFFIIVGAGPAYCWLKEKIRSSVGADKRSDQEYPRFNYIIDERSMKDES